MTYLLRAIGVGQITMVTPDGRDNKRIHPYDNRVQSVWYSSGTVYKHRVR